MLSRESSAFSPVSRPLVQWTEKGLYCEAGNFYVDPHRRVEHAVITHAHADHARRGSENYYCEKSGVGLLKSRIGPQIRVTGVPYRETFQLGATKVSFHSAGHILGSAQVRIEHAGEVWVCSGDYKRDPDPSCAPFEVVKCDTYITEATFGTPKYAWDKTRNHGLDIHAWWKKNEAQGVNSLLFGYSLGKAQRILAELAPYAHRPVLVHGTIEELNESYRQEGIRLAPTLELSRYPLGARIEGELILAPPSILKTEWYSRLGEFETAFASGWMQGSTSSHGSHYDHGFVMSDHADWEDLNRTIRESGARRVFVQHRENGVFVRHLKKLGLEAYAATELSVGNYARLPTASLSLFPGL